MSERKMSRMSISRRGIFSKGMFKWGMSKRGMSGTISGSTQDGQLLCSTVRTLSLRYLTAFGTGCTSALQWLADFAFYSL